MYRWLRRCRIWLMCLAAILLLSTGFPVLAAPPESGTLKIRLNETEYSVEFAVYRVADYVDGNYDITAEFAGSREDLNALENASDVEECSGALKEWAKSQGIEPMYQMTTQNGQLNLGKVELGMYLVVQVPHEDDRLQVSNVLVGVPYWKTEIVGGTENKVLEYNVEAQPKSEEVIELPIEPKPPTKPVEEVKTGDQAGDQVRVYGILMIAAAGVAYAAGRRRRVEE